MVVFQFGASLLPFSTTLLTMCALARSFSFALQFYGDEMISGRFIENLKCRSPNQIEKNCILSNIVFVIMPKSVHLQLHNHISTSTQTIDKSPITLIDN